LRGLVCFASAWALILNAAVTGSPSQDPKPKDERPQPPVEVYDWSIWVGSPAQTSTNTSRAYANTLPGAIGTTRPKAEEKGSARPFPISPITVVQVFGEPTRDLDFDLQIKKGTLLAHWPKGHDRGGRIQWFKSDLLSAPTADLPPGYIPENHWLHKLRLIETALYLKNESSVDRFLVYDAELAMSAPVKLRGGPDEYTLQNLTSHRLLDVALIVPTDKGFRVGWLDELPTAVPDKADSADGEAKKKGEPKQPTDETAAARKVFQEADAEAAKPKLAKPDEVKPLPPEGDSEIRARVDQILNRPVSVNVEKPSRKQALDLIAGQARFRYTLDEPTLAKAEVDLGESVNLQTARVAARDALADVLGGAGLSYRVTDDGSLFITTAGRLADADGKKGVVIEGPPIKLTLSQPLEGSNPSYRELTRDSLARRLAKQGMREEVLQALLDQYSGALFEPGEVIVLSHLSREGIDEAVVFDVFPTPKKLVRTALVVTHGIDPRLQDRARDLVRKLGDPSPKSREEAESQLFSLGAVAVPALEDALSDKDIEIVFRVERLLMRLNRPVP
jgi:hypothetical protein